MALRHGVSHASELDARVVRRDGHMLSVPHTIKHDTPTFQSDRLAQWRSARDKARNSAACEHWLCARGIFSAFFRCATALDPSQDIVKETDDRYVSTSDQVRMRWFVS